MPHEGYALVSFKVDHRGYVYNVNVLEEFSEPTDRFAAPFGKAAREAMKKWHFRYREQACESTMRFKFSIAS